MNVVQEVDRARHPFLDGKIKRLLIDGNWVEAASGKTFESLNPATGEILATVAEGDTIDIDRAVARRGAPSRDRGAGSNPTNASTCSSSSPIWSSGISTS
jgi:hypothetical protein